MLTDYHTHSWRCGHAVGRMEEYIEQAIEKHIDDIGLTDHLYLYFLPPGERNAQWAMDEQSFDAHVEEMVELRERYQGRVNVRVSVEADFAAGHEEALREIVARYPFDYVLGSVHFVDGWLIDDPAASDRYARERISDVYLRYYELLQKAIATRSFDLLAHFDLPKKFGYRPERDITPAVLATLDAAAAYGVAIEVSSAGLRKPVNEIYPESSILEEMRRREIAIAFSSDAHDPREVGYAFDQLTKAAWQAGYRELVTFDRRERHSHDFA